jgi:branched-chain amino acid transport system permease protein
MMLGSRQNNIARTIGAIHGLSLCTLLIAPLFASEYWRFLIFQIVVIAYLAVGFDLSYSYARILSFMHAVFFAVGAYAAVLLVSNAPWSLPAALGAGAGGAAIAGAAFGGVLVRMKNHNPTVATVIIVSIAFLAGNALSEYSGGDDGLLIAGRSIGFAGAQIPLGPGLVLYYIAAVPLAGIAMGRRLLEKRLVWKVMRAVAQNDVRAQQLGFDVTLRRLVIFTASAAIAGVGGVFYALLMRHVSTATMEIGLSINAILYAVVGGIGTAFGAVVGVLLIYPFTELVSLYVAYVPIFVGILLTMVSVYAPRGVIGSLLWALQEADTTEPHAQLSKESREEEIVSNA